MKDEQQRKRAAHIKAKRKRRTEKYKKHVERLRVKRLLSQLTNKEIDESFERAIEK